MRLGSWPGREETRVASLGSKEALMKLLVHFIRGLGDAWADGGGDPLSPGAELLHRGDRPSR